MRRTGERTPTGVWLPHVTSFAGGRCGGSGRGVCSRGAHSSYRHVLAAHERATAAPLLATAASRSCSGRFLRVSQRPQRTFAESVTPRTSSLSCTHISFVPILARDIHPVEVVARIWFGVTQRFCFRHCCGECLCTASNGAKDKRQRTTEYTLDAHNRVRRGL